MKGRTTEKISKGKGSMKTTGNKRKREKGIDRRSKELLKGNPCKAGKIVITTWNHHAIPKPNSLHKVNTLFRNIHRNKLATRNSLKMRSSATIKIIRQGMIQEECTLSHHSPAVTFSMKQACLLPITHSLQEIHQLTWIRSTLINDMISMLVFVGISATFWF